MCASEVRFVPGSYVEADHVNGRPYCFSAGHYLSENLGSNVLFTNFDSWTRAVHIEVSLR